MTNYEKIKNLSIEEMTNYLFTQPLDFNPCNHSCIGCRFYRKCRQGDMINNEIKKEIQKWLESEVEERK